MKHDAVIFDMDGTILNTLEDLSNSVNFALKKNGLPKRTTEEIRAFVGNGIRLLVERAMPENCDGKTLENVFSDFKEHYKLHSLDNTCPYEGVVDLLKKLKAQNIPTAVVSNKIDSQVKLLCNKFFDGLFDAAVGEQEGLRKKPYPDAVFEVIKKIGCKCPIYVGDSEIDVKTAENSKIDGVFVTWGFRDKEILTKAGAKLIVDTTIELYDNL